MMGVDWYSCVICGETFPDCGTYYNCACGCKICSHCYGDQLEKYGTVDENSEDADNFGDEALKKCDDCVNYENREELLKDLKARLIEYGEYELLKRLETLF